jgi:tRNA (pseudouridine54-N1)-methyltransferase
MRRFVIVGQRATASPDFLLDDLAGTSGRLDVLLRSLRAALLVSHGLRRDTIVYLVLLGGPRAPVSLRFEGAHVKFLRPEERSLATLVKKVLALDCEATSFEAVKPGIAMARAGLEAVIADLGTGTRYMLDEGAPDVRGVELDARDGVFFVGDHLGFDEMTRAELVKMGAIAVGLGPVSLHAEDAVAIVGNEMDRRAMPQPSPRDA